MLIEQCFKEEVFGRRLRLLWCFRNEDNNASYNPFRPKSTVNPRGKDVAIELYLSRLEEEILAIDTELSYSNLTTEERNALKCLRNENLHYLRSKGTFGTNVIMT